MHHGKSRGKRKSQKACRPTKHGNFTKSGGKFGKVGEMKEFVETWGTGLKERKKGKFLICGR